MSDKTNVYSCIHIYIYNFVELNFLQKSYKFTIHWTFFVFFKAIDNKTPVFFIILVKITIYKLYNKRFILISQYINIWKISIYTYKKKTKPLAYIKWNTVSLHRKNVKNYFGIVEMIFFLSRGEWNEFCLMKTSPGFVYNARRYRRTGRISI